MKSNKIVFLTLIVFHVGFSNPASAQLHAVVEPYVGWNLAGSAQQGAIPASIDQGTFNGLGFGAKGVLSVFGTIFGGIDFSLSPSLNVQPTSASYFEQGTSLTRLGIIAGVNVPILPLRFWLGFNFLDKLSNTPQVNRSSVASGSNVSLSGTGMKAGVGFTFLPLVSLNLEYIYSKYNTLNLNNTDLPINTGALEGMSTKSILLSASFPFRLGY